MPGYIIQHLLEDSAYSHVQVIWTEDEPSSSDYTEAAYRAERMGKPKLEVTYDKDLMKLIGLKSLQDVIDSTPKSAKKKRKSRGKLAEGNIMGYTVDTSYGDVKISSTSFPLSQGGVFIQVDYKNKEYKSGDKDMHVNWIHRLKQFLGKDLTGFTEFRMKKLGPEWVPLIDAVKEKTQEELKNVSVSDLNDAGLASNYLFDHHMANLSQLAEYRDLLEPSSPLRKYIDESEKVLILLRKYVDLVSILKYFGEKVSDAIRQRYNTDLLAAPKCKLALLYVAVKDRYPLVGQLTMTDDKTCKAIAEYINLIDNKIEQEYVLQLTGT